MLLIDRFRTLTLDVVGWGSSAVVGGWHTWIGVGGLLYARRLKSSPPVVYRSTDPAELEARIREHEGGQR